MLTYQIDNLSKQLSKAKNLDALRPAVDGLLCFAAMVGSGEIDKACSFDDSVEHFEQILHTDCTKCKACNVCPICKLEE